MKTDMTLGPGLDTEDEAVRYDAACRRVLSNKTILAHIMKTCMGEYKDCAIDEIAQNYIEGQPQTYVIPVMPDDEGVIQEHDVEDRNAFNGFRTYDICFRANVPDSNERLAIIIKLATPMNITSTSRAPRIRQAIYYSSCLMSSYYSAMFKNANHDKIKKFYFFWICTNPDTTSMNSISQYSLASDATMGDTSKPDRDCDLFSIIMINLSGPGGGNYDGLIRLLDILLSGDTSEVEKREVLQNEFSIPLTQTFKEAISAMFSSGVAPMEEGIARGIAEIKRGS